MFLLSVLMIFYSFSLSREMLSIPIHLFCSHQFQDLVEGGFMAAYTLFHEEAETGVRDGSKISA
jgi:hypothetical protein